MTSSEHFRPFRSIYEDLLKDEGETFKMTVIVTSRRGDFTSTGRSSPILRIEIQHGEVLTFGKILKFEWTYAETIGTFNRSTDR